MTKRSEKCEQCNCWHGKRVQDLTPLARDTLHVLRAPHGHSDETLVRAMTNAALVLGELERAGVVKHITGD